MTAPLSESLGRSSPERALLLLARSEMDATSQQEVRGLVASDVDWGRALELAEQSEVAPAVCCSLQRLGFPGVPPSIRQAFEEARRRTAAHNALLVRELMRLLRLLDGAGIPAIPMKGVALAETLYGDPTLRVCADLDVLVPRDRATAALRLLRTDGYATEFTERFFETLLLRRHIEYTLARDVRGFRYLVDLHWGIGWSAPSDRRAVEALWADSRRVTRWGVETWAMSPEWELVTLAVHAARHGWQPLKWLVDVHDYCARALDWSTVRTIASRFGWLPAVEQTLGVCRQLLGTPVPPGLGSAPLKGRSAMPSTGQSGAADPEPLVLLRLIQPVRERARYLTQLLMVPTLAERRLVRLPPALTPLYYPLRPARLAGKWAWRILAGLLKASRQPGFPL